MSALPALYPLLYEPLLRQALAEDLGRAGDLTSDAILPDDLLAEARLVARAPGRVAGLVAANRRLPAPRPAPRRRSRGHDGEDAAAGELLATIAGPARSLLSAERTALTC